MQRWHKDYPRTIRRWKEHRKDHELGNRESRYFVEYYYENQFGRFRKRKSTGVCSIPHCSACKGHKYPKRIRTFQEKFSALSMKEQLDELV